MNKKVMFRMTHINEKTGKTQIINKINKCEILYFLNDLKLNL